ncbi:MAG: hypothetical protein GTO44_10035 [Hydrotalea flava]|nr:hypothetical protein [Hydrotalea flava]
MSDRKTIKIQFTRKEYDMLLKMAKLFDLSPEQIIHDCIKINYFRNTINDGRTGMKK